MMAVMAVISNDFSATKSDLSAISMQAFPNNPEGFLLIRLIEHVGNPGFLTAHSSASKLHSP
jgi:hypothetical protein